jgi:hypothetical protein
MGTTLSDTLYSGLAHTAARVPIPPRQLRAIESRWLTWEPFCIQRAREHSDYSSMLAAYKTTHRFRVILLLSSQIRWEGIRLHRLDCPTDSAAEFESKLRLVIKRRPRGYKHVK